MFLKKMRGVYITAAFWLLGPAQGTAQTYHAAEESPLSYLFEYPSGRLETAAAGVGQSGLILDPEEEILSRAQWGGSVRAMYYFSDILAAGAAGSRLSGVMRHPALSSADWLRAGVTVKVILTPQVLPRQYVVAETGAERRTSRDIVLGRQKKRGFYARLGIGLEFKVWNRAGMFAEYAGVYSSLPDINKLMTRSGRWEQQVSCGVSVYW